MSRVPILKQGRTLIASFQDAVSDTAWGRLRDELMSQATTHRSRGVVIDVSAMDVMDSYATRMLETIAGMLRLKGAETVVVGIQPGVAMAMTQLGLRLASARTALDLEEGLALLEGDPPHGANGRG